MARRNVTNPQAEQPQTMGSPPESTEQPEPQAESQQAYAQETQETPPKPDRAEQDKQLDRVRNHIAGARRVLEHLRSSGTGQDKLNLGEDHIQVLQRRLGGTQIAPITPDKDEQRAGALDLIKAMAGNWPEATIDKANAEAEKI